MDGPGEEAKLEVRELLIVQVTRASATFSERSVGGDAGFRRQLAKCA
jgi:hypothetical protein